VRTKKRRITAFSKQLAKALDQRTMEAELTFHLGCEKHDQGEKTAPSAGTGKRRFLKPYHARAPDNAGKKFTQKQGRRCFEQSTGYSTLNFDTSLNRTSMFSLFFPLMMLT
jgi:hypothetical protein